MANKIFASIAAIAATLAPLSAFAGGISSKVDMNINSYDINEISNYTKAAVGVSETSFSKDQANAYAAASQSEATSVNLAAEDFTASYAQEANASQSASQTFDGDAYIVGGLFVVPPIGFVAGAAAGVDAEATQDASQSSDFAAGFAADGSLALSTSNVATQQELIGIETVSLDQNNAEAYVSSELTVTTTQESGQGASIEATSKSLF